MPTIREILEQREERLLAPQAARSAATRGRLRPEPEDDIRPAYQRDRDRILHCKAFRRLKHKTQVFFAPTGDHYRTRLTHTLEVSQIARTIAKSLALHEELTEAIALGHDVGHAPFGHHGERVLADLVPGGFEHYLQSLRVVDVLERDGAGLNLTLPNVVGFDNVIKALQVETADCIKNIDEIAAVPGVDSASIASFTQGLSPAPPR